MIDLDLDLLDVLLLVLTTILLYTRQDIAANMLNWSGSRKVQSGKSSNKKRKRFVLIDDDNSDRDSDPDDDNSTPDEGSSSTPSTAKRLEVADDDDNPNRDDGQNRKPAQKGRRILTGLSIRRFRDIYAKEDGSSGETDNNQEGDPSSDYPSSDLSGLIDDRLPPGDVDNRRLSDDDEDRALRMTKSQLRAMATMGSKSGRMQGRRGERRDETDEYEYESDEYKDEFSDLAALCVRVFSDLKVEDIGYVTKSFKNILDGLDASFASNIIIYIREKMGDIVDRSQVHPAKRINREKLAEMYKKIRRQVVCLLVKEYQESTKDFNFEIDAGEASKYPPLFEKVGVFLNVMLPYTIVAYVWLSFIRFFDAPETDFDSPQLKEEYISQFLSILRTFIIYFNDLENFHKQAIHTKKELAFEHTESRNPEFKDLYVDTVSDILVYNASGYVSAMLTLKKKQSVFFNEDDPGLLKDAYTANTDVSGGRIEALGNEIYQRRILRSTQDGQDDDAQISRFAVFDEETSNRRFGKHIYLKGNLGGDFSLETCQDDRHFEILDQNFVFGLLSIVNTPVVYLNLEIMNKYYPVIKKQSSHSELFKSYWETRYRVQAVDENREPKFKKVTRGNEQILEPVYESKNLANILGFYIVNPLAYQYMALFIIELNRAKTAEMFGVPVPPSNEAKQEEGEFVSFPSYVIMYQLSFGPNRYKVNEDLDNKGISNILKKNKSGLLLQQISDNDPDLTEKFSYNPPEEPKLRKPLIIPTPREITNSEYHKLNNQEEILKYKIDLQKERLPYLRNRKIELKEQLQNASGSMFAFMESSGENLETLEKELREVDKSMNKVQELKEELKNIRERKNDIYVEHLKNL